jgi:hypothetical protein
MALDALEIQLVACLADAAANSNPAAASAAVNARAATAVAEQMHLMFV